MVNKQDDIAGAGDDDLFGFGDEGIRVADAFERKATGADEGFVGVELAEGELGRGAEHDFGGAIEGAAQDKDIAVGVIGEVICDTEGIGDDADTFGGDIGGHAAGSGTAVEDNGVAVTDELGGGAADAVFFGGEEVAAFGERGGSWDGCSGAGKAAADASGEALGGEGVEIAADGGAAGTQAACLFLNGEEGRCGEGVEETLVAFCSDHMCRATNCNFVNIIQNMTRMSRGETGLDQATSAEPVDKSRCINMIDFDTLTSGGCHYAPRKLCFRSRRRQLRCTQSKASRRI